MQLQIVSQIIGFLHTQTAVLYVNKTGPSERHGLCVFNLDAVKHR